MVFLGVGFQRLVNLRGLPRVIASAMRLALTDARLPHESDELVIGKVGKKLLRQRQRVHDGRQWQMPIRPDCGTEQERHVETLDIMTDEGIRTDEIKKIRQNLVDGWLVRQIGVRDSGEPTHLWRNRHGRIDELAICGDRFAAANADRTKLDDLLIGGVKTSGLKVDGGVVSFHRLTDIAFPDRLSIGLWFFPETSLWVGLLRHHAERYSENSAADESRRTIIGHRGDCVQGAGREQDSEEYP